MKYVFAGALAVLAALSVVAWAVRPRAAGAGKTPLVWVSDDNPARREQIELFNLLLHAGDVDWPGFSKKLHAEAVADRPCPSRQLWGLLPPAAREAVRDAAQGQPLDAGRQRQALQALNDVLARRDFYWEADFPGVTLEADEETTLMDEGALPSALAVRAVNVRLLEQSYPGLVARRLHLRLDPSNVGMQKVIVQCIGGVGPDLFDCYDGFQLSAYAKSGIAVEVTDELAAAGVNVEKDCWAAAHPNCIYEGRTYGFPTNASVNAIWLNKDIFDRHGIAYPKGPWTWDEFIPLAQRLTVKGADGRIKHFGLMMDWWNWRHFCLQWGGRVYTPDGTRCVLDSPENIAGIQLMRDLVYKYHVAPSPVEEAAIATAGGWGSGTISFFGGGKAAMALGGRWWLCTLRKYEGLRLGAVECPHGPQRTYRGYGRSTLVNKNGPHRDQALAFLRYMAGKEYNELINHQADALAPVIRYCYTDLYLHDPDFPNEDFNAVWRDIMQYGVPDEVSPFVNGNVAGRIIGKQLDMVRNGTKPPADAMRKAAEQINEEIAKNLDRDPELRQRFDELAGKVKGSR